MRIACLALVVACARGLDVPPAAGRPACSADAECATGHCADGVCCESACSGTCLTCAGDATHAAGTCRDAPDNTDARGECGLCGACFARSCAPALVGTDPNHGCPSGQLCGASQTCGLAGGAACTSAAQCAVGDCFPGKCEQVSTERVFVDPMQPTATGRRARGIAISESGAVSLAIDEWSTDTQGSVFENDLFLATRAPGGTWSAVDLFTDKGAGTGTIVASLAYLGPTAFVAAFDYQASGGACPAQEPDAPCGLFGQLVFPGSQTGRHEVIDGDVRFVAWVELYLDDGGALIAAYDGDRASDPNIPRRVYVRRRQVSASGVSWTALAQIDPGFSDWSAITWGSALLGGRPAILFADSIGGQMLAYRLLPQEGPVSVALPPAGASACAAAEPTLRRVSLGGVDQALVSAFCDNGSQGGPIIGTFRPGDAAPKLAPVGFPVVNALPLGLLQGAPAYELLIELEDVPVVDDVQVGLQQADGTLRLRTSFHPRGLSDTVYFLGALGPDGLPALAVTSGTRPDPASLPPPLDVLLVRYHP